jgi:hypothetical protein
MRFRGPGSFARTCPLAVRGLMKPRGAMDPGPMQMRGRHCHETESRVFPGRVRRFSSEPRDRSSINPSSFIRSPAVVPFLGVASVIVAHRWKNNRSFPLRHFIVF